MSLTTEDKDLLASTVNNALSQIPSFLRGAVNMGSMNNFLHSIPQSFRKYTLEELLAAIEELYNNKKIKN
jgi:hypothetical protein